MSLNEIIDELPRLSHQERRELCRRVIDLESEHDDMVLCDAGKMRPCLLLTDYLADDELAMVTVLPHTPAVKGNRWELNIPKPFLKPGAFHLQQIQSISVAYLMRRLGTLTAEELGRVTDMLCRRLGC